MSILQRTCCYGIAVVCSIVLSASLSAQQTTSQWSADIQSIIEAGRNGNQVQNHLDYLTNRIGPRLTGSEGLTAGCEWSRESFEAMGLSNCRLEQWGEVPVGFERGPAYGRMIEPKPLELNFGTNAWTAGTQGRVVGSAVLGPESLEALESMRDQLPGAYVLVPRATRGRMGGRRRSSSEQTPPASEEAVDPAAKAAEEERARLEAERAEAERALQASIRDELLRSGVAGLIQPTFDELILTSGSFQIEWENLPTTPIISLQKEQYDEIHTLLTAGEKVTLGFDIRNHFRKGPIPLYNVIADISGTEFPDEYVIVGGHIDSWDGATGATDNAAGCATTMEAARILMAAGVKPRRTIRFMLWSGEEQGLLGSIAYAEQNRDLMPKISAVLVHDGGTNYVAGIGGTKTMLEDFEKIFAPAMSLDERAPFEIRTVEAIVPRGGSDHVAFIREGVPGFFWDQRGRANYRTTHHTQFDTFDSVVPEYQEHSSIVIALGAFGIANLDHLLSRDGVESGR